MKNNKNSISRSVLTGCAIFITLLSLILGSLGFLTYYSGMIDKYETYLHDILMLAQTEIDADDLEQCIADREKSEKYEQAQDFLNRIKENYNVQYVYIVKPLNLNMTDNMMDVMAGITQEEADENLEYYSVTLGALTGDYYSPDIVKYYLGGMAEPGKVLFFRNKSDEFGYVYTGLVSLRNSSGDPVAVLAIDLSMAEISRTWTRYCLIMLAEIIVLVSLFLFSMYKWLCKRVIEPLKKLEVVTQSFVKSSHHTQDPSRLNYQKADIHTGDEMEVMSNALSVMFDDMKRYMANLLSMTAEKERIGTELNVAAQIQEDMLPRIFPPFPNRTEFDLYATMHTAKEVGGDFYDFFMIDDDHLGLVIADVSGKGVPAALFMVIAKTLIKTRTLMGDSPSTVLHNVNEQLCEGNDSMLFVTVWIGILSISTGKGLAANAGHEHPVIKRAGGQYELVKYRHSPAVAVMEGISFQEHEFELHPGDKLFVYTDGVPEATNADDELFGDQRMLEALNQNPQADPKEVLHEVWQGINSFVKDAPQFDDITMLCLQYNGSDEDPADAADKE